MAKFINVKRDVQDPYYRYKMPRILAKVEGKGNGIKTVISNMSEVAKALSRPPTYPTKYFGCELGAQTNFDQKNDRYIVNGEHDANKLQDILDGFIKRFVLCPECDNPETTLSIRRQIIHSKCKACGHAFTVDNKHKVTTFIIKNPPPVEPSEESKEAREGGSPTEEIDVSAIDAENGKTLSADDDDNDDWADPIELHEQLNSQIGKLVLNPDLEKSAEERLDMLHNYFVKAKEDGNIGDGKHLLNEAERLELKTKAPLLLARTLLSTDIINDLKTYRLIFLRFCVEDKKAQRYLLGGIEQWLVDNPELMSRAPRIIKTLYDLDLCTEDSILSWGAKPSSRCVKKETAKEIIKLCEPIFNWLKEAEEETDSEDDDDDIAVSFDDRSRVIGTVIEKKEVPQVNGKNVAPASNGKDEDLDIDNI